MYINSVMIFTLSIRDFGHPQLLKSQFGHPVMKILAKSYRCEIETWNWEEIVFFLRIVPRGLSVAERQSSTMPRIYIATKPTRNFGGPAES